MKPVDQVQKPLAGWRLRRFDAFRRHYNEERPHEALNHSAPGAYCAASRRAMPSRMEDPWYDTDHQVRRIRTSGEIMWKGERIFISEALVGIAELETGDHVVRFCAHDVGILDRKGRFRRFAPPRAGLREPTEPPHPTDLSGIIPVQYVDHQPG